MLEDKWLLWKLRHGRADALCRIYEKYKNDLLALAIALSNDKTGAEDTVHDVFVSFAQTADKLQLRGSLKSYLSVSVANRVRNLGRAKSQRAIQLDTVEFAAAGSNCPERLAISREESQKLGSALALLPHQQREAIILHI